MKQSEQGSIIVEVLVGLILLSIMAMGLTRSTISSMYSREHAVRSSNAMQIASDTIETLTALDPGNLSDANDITSDTVTKNGVDYTRTVDVTVNADETRTIAVTVTAVTTKLGGKASLTVTAIPWGEA